jgi:ATP-binding protein involved in chromosome partitioning
MTESLHARIENALATLTNSRTGQNLVVGSQVRDIATTTDGKVRLTLLLHATDDATLARETRRVLATVEGVTDVRVDVKDAAEFQQERAAHSAANVVAPKQRSALPVMDAAPAAARTSAPTPVAYPNLGRIIAVS